MDQILGDYTILNILKTSLIMFLLPIVFIIVFNYIISRVSKPRSLPPGLMPWPLIGNIFQLEKKVHISVTNLAKVYGPLMSLKLGTQIVIIASSPATAAEILKNHDHMLSARFIRKAIPFPSNVLERTSLAWNPKFSDQWKLFRSLSRTELFSAKAIESQARLREKKLTEMIEFLSRKQGEVVNMRDCVCYCF
ncbi:Cytochrome P450 76T24 [Euphorbia peplus]|nr:Cytochrome P450 76T24 [Euphorbia peplus]